MKKRILWMSLACLIGNLTIQAEKRITVPVEAGDMTQHFQAALDEAHMYAGEPVVIQLQKGDYHLSRSTSTKRIYYISNTTSEQENPDQTKHIGLWLKGLKEVTIDGGGARLVTHGEMTTFVIDSCERITLRNFTVTAADPTVPEMTVEEVGNNYMNVRIHPQSRYEIKNGKFAFVGDSWRLDGGIAQYYDPERDITWRGWSPLPSLKRAVELEPGLLRFEYEKKPQAIAGQIFQMRDGIRDEACGLIQYSKDITIEDAHFAFLGNFGLVGQMSENITYHRVRFEPEKESGRTCAGFADFVQMSGCKGKIQLEQCRFVGAHDDPINIHGTHLSVRKWIAPNQVLVRYMHPQTYGFQSFLPGNEVDFIDAHTLLPVETTHVEKAEMQTRREILVTLTENMPEAIRNQTELVVENVSYTPEVVVRDCYFARIPSRGLLVTTRRPVLVENNTFFRMQMHGLLIADDARSWFESGMVRDVTVRGNHFIECAEPVINIAPENDQNAGPVHRNIRIENNRFELIGIPAISAKSVEGLKINNNLFQERKATTLEQLITTTDCTQVEIENNRQEVKQ